MGAFGSILGGILTVGAIALGIWTTWVFTNSYLPLLWFTAFGILGGISLGSLNGSKARSMAKYKNEYTAYVGMFIAAIIFLGVYYFFFALFKIEDKLKEGVTLNAQTVLILSIAGGFIGLLGVGLTLANALAEESYRRY